MKPMNSVESDHMANVRRQKKQQYLTNLPSHEFGRQFVQEWESTRLVAERTLRWSVRRAVSDSTPSTSGSPAGNLSVESPTTGNTARKFCACRRWDCGKLRRTGSVTRPVRTYDTTCSASCF